MSSGLPHADAGRSVAPARRPGPAGIVTAAAMGTAFEIYDFTLFAFFSAILAPTFFPALSRDSSLLLTAATFGIAAIVRPIGALFFGLYGDRVGRKPVLILTLTLMAVGSVTIGLVPGYQTIGIWAPILVATARILQGFSAGGELSGAATFVAEQVPPHRKGLYLGYMASAGLGATLLSSGLGLLLTTLLGDQQMAAWGWRIPFLLGGLIVPVGYYIRQRLPESDEYLATQRDIAGGAATPPIRLGHLLLVAGLFIPSTVTNYLGLVSMPTYLSSRIGISLDIAFEAAFIGSIIVTVCLPLVGSLTDHIGRRPPIRLGYALTLAGAYPLFHALQGAPSAGRIIAVQSAFALLIVLPGSALQALAAEQFPAARRSLGMALAQIVPISVFGVCSPVIVTWLIMVTGSTLAPSFYLMGCAAVGLTALSLLPAGTHPLHGKGRSRIFSFK